MSHSLVPLQLPDEALIRRTKLLTYLPFGSQTLWRRVKAERFPKPIVIDGCMTAWRWKDVRAWLEAQGQERAA